MNDPQDEDLWGNELNDGMDIIDAAIYAVSGAGSGGVPAGTMLDFAGATAPAGYLLCAGQAVSRVTYDALFAAIGTVWGAGDGATTFNLPDFRGRVGAGKDDMNGSAANRLTGLTGGVNGAVLGAVGGLQTHTLTTAQLATHAHTGSIGSSGAHTHDISANNQIETGDATRISFNALNATSNQNAFKQVASTGTVSTLSTLFPGKTIEVISASSGAHTHTFTSDNAGSGDAHNNVQPTAIVLKIIKT